MPELPEVEVIRRGLVPHVVGRRFLSAVPGKKRLRRQAGAEELAAWVAGRRLQKLSRRGKYLLFSLEGGATLVIHLGMTGRLLLGPLPQPGPDHVHLVFKMEGGVEMAYQDLRRFGQILVYPPGTPVEPLAAVGREPFSRRVTPEWLEEQARGRTRPIKNFLLDGRVMAGIGNIYASEILFAARINPGTPAGKLRRQDWARVLIETRRILAHAIRKGGTTVANYLNSRGETGLFQLELKVYGKAGEPCSSCGRAITRLTQGGRSSFFCPKCQG
jgi:formamidopyrimidine-DNA glycosylase